MLEEYKNILLGAKIGSGCYRDVYNCRLRDDLVVKIEREDKEFHNIKEWTIWSELEYADEYNKWLAPCLEISKNGKILIQKKVEFGRQKEYPKEIPSFFTDVKPDNFGFIGNQLVCCDYGSTIFTRFFNKKLIKADWKQEKFN